MMPMDDAIGAMNWAIQKCTECLKESKMLPIMLAGMKHQDQLRNLGLQDCTLSKH